MDQNIFLYLLQLKAQEEGENTPLGFKPGYRVDTPPLGCGVALIKKTNKQTNKQTNMAYPPKCSSATIFEIHGR